MNFSISFILTFTQKERKEEIRKILKEKGYSNKPITYQEFLELYEPYKEEMKESDFAGILEISYGNHGGMKYKGQRAIILKEEKEIPEERKEEIRKGLKEKGYSNKLITYQEFLELYKPYKEEMKEKKFAEIIGISYGNYHHMKNHGTRTKIKFNYKELNRIKYQLKLESREYKKEELEKLCEKYEVTLEELLLELYPNSNINTLINKEILYIGTCPIPKDFLQKYSEELLRVAQSLSKIISRKYKLGGYREDIASDVLLRVIEKKGELVKNSESEEETLEVIKKYMAVAIKYQYINRCRVKGKISLDVNIGKDKKSTRYAVVKAPEKEIQFKEEEESEEKIVEDMKRCYEEGMESAEAILYVRKKYGISREELLKILEEELSKKRKIVRTSTGNVYLGEEYDD